MVRLRPDPRGANQPELYRWHSSLGPFRKLHFLYAKYRWFDWALKHPKTCMMMMSFVAGPIILAIETFRVATGASKMNPYIVSHAERPFEYAEWARDLKGIRGEWNNNFSCWSDNPDCGKDYKPKFTS